MKPTASTAGLDVPLGPERRRALRTLGDHWTLWLLVAVNELHGARFTDLAAEPGLSRRVLTERLVALVESGLLRTVRYSTHPPRNRYLLTDRGVRVRRIALALAHVGAGGLLTDELADVTRPTRSPDVAPASQAPAAPQAAVADESADQHPATLLLEANHAAARQIYVDTIAPLVRYDDQYRTQLVETLETWLTSDASASVTAARMYAHRHTIRYRLARVRELTGLDVDALADRERLALGLRALRMFERQGIDVLDG